MNKIWNRFWMYALRTWVLEHFQEEIIIYKVCIKKGKRKEWRTYNANGERITYG